MHDILPKLSKAHNKVRVVIADDLMVYNRYSINFDPEKASRIFDLYWQERFNNITKIVTHYQLNNITINQYNDFCDQKFMALFRRFWCIAQSDERLYQQINEKAQWFIKTRIKQASTNNRQQEFEIIRQFVIEETAWSIHLAENHGITDEYYPNDHASLLKYIYHYENSSTFLSLINANNHQRRYWSINSEKNNTFTKEWHYPANF